MARNIKKYFSVFLQMQKIGIMNRMAYPVNFFVMVGAVFFVMFLEVFFISTMFRFFPSVAGWTYHQALLVVGSFMLIEGMGWIFFAQLNSISIHIKDGTMDSVMIKPIDSQFLVSIWRGDFEDISRIVSGLALLWYAVSHLGIFGWHLVVNSFFYLILLFSGFVIIYSLNLMIRCISFWAIEGYGIWSIVESITSVTQYPTDVFYGKAIRAVITFIIPLVFIATAPAKILAHGVDAKLILQSILTALVFATFSRLLWKFSLNRYSSASS